MHPSRFALALLLAGCATPAAAQEGVDWGGLMAGIAHGTAMDEAAQESVSVNRRGGNTRAAPAPQARLTYKPSIERRRINFARFVETSRKNNPKGAALLEKALASDPITKLGAALSVYGMRTDNVADAYAIWWLNAWLASRQRNDTPPAHQIAAVRAQAARAMAALPAIATASDAAKQEMAEANLIQAALIGSFMDQAEGKPAQLRELAASVSKGARASGLDLEAMNLTDKGFVPAS